jgi:hypothetical protein
MRIGRDDTLRGHRGFLLAAAFDPSIAIQKGDNKQADEEA